VTLVAFLQGQDFDQICHEAYKQHGTTAAEILAMTPAEIMSTFFVTSKEPVDRVEQLASINRERAKKGQRPTAPSWHLAEHRRPKK
jgi:hypothetical protein